MNRCGSPATTAEPVAVRAAVTSQPLLPEVPGPSVAKSAAESSPRQRATSSRHSFVGKPAKRMCVESHTASGTHGSHTPGSSPVRANSGLRRAPSASPALTPST